MVASLAISAAALGINSYSSGMRLQEKVLLEQQTVQEDEDGINLAILNKKTQKVIKLFPLKVSPEQYIDQVLNMVRPEIKISNLNFSASSQSIQLVGQADSREDILKLKERIGNHTSFTNVELHLAVLDSQTNTDFTIKFKIVKNDSK